MNSQSWKTTLTADIDAAALDNIRTWLRTHHSTVPAGHDDLIAKYLRIIIETNMGWHGIHAPVTITQPRIVPLPGQGIEQEVRLVASVPFLPLLRYVKRLALGSFGLLAMLACWVAFAA